MKWEECVPGRIYSSNKKNPPFKILKKAKCTLEWGVDKDGTRWGRGVCLLCDAKMRRAFGGDQSCRASVFRAAQAQLAEFVGYYEISVVTRSTKRGSTKIMRIRNVCAKCYHRMSDATHRAFVSYISSTKQTVRSPTCPLTYQHTSLLIDRYLYNKHPDKRHLFPAVII